jgi:DNA replication protein DnaD
MTDNFRENAQFSQLLQVLHCVIEKPCIYIFKDGNPFTKSTKHVEANVNTQKENQNNQNNTNEVNDLMLKGHPLPQIN